MARLLLPFTALLIVACFDVGSADAQTAAAFRFEFKEEPGPYAVGLKVVEQFDRLRSFQTTPASPENSVASDGPRPLQTLLWYPAEKSSHETMTFGDYGALIKTETSFGRPLEQGKPQSFVEAFMRGTTDLHASAIRNAPTQTGRFPVLIYAPSVNAPATENIELCEYLASQGFVVIASPSMGAASRTMTVDVPGANAEAEDISFLIDFAATLPDTDMSKVAAIGYSWGGMAALFASGRDKRIDVLVSLDGSFRYCPEIVQEAGDIHPERMTMPLLVFSRAEEPLESWDAMRKDKHQCAAAPNVLNEWTHGDLLHVRLLAISHIQFSSLYQRSERFRKEGLQFVPADYSLQDGAESYNWMAPYLKAFLDTYLKHDPTASQFITHSPAEDGVPKHLISVSLRPASIAPDKNDLPARK
jgi:pimeloyl-ACP methyl ester carboxylesterase